MQRALSISPPKLLFPALSQASTRQQREQAGVLAPEAGPG